MVASLLSNDEYIELPDFVQENIQSEPSIQRRRGKEKVYDAVKLFETEI